MPTAGPNIVQAEFFHAGGTSNSIQDILEEYKEHISESVEHLMRGSVYTMPPKPRIKTSVRFYDVDGVLTSLVNRAAWQEKHFMALLESDVSSSMIRSVVRRVRLQHVLKQKMKLGSRLHTLAIVALETRLKEKQGIAIEKPDRTFRFLDKAEEHELLEAARFSLSSWLFLFRHNDLLADKNISAGYKM